MTPFDPIALARIAVGGLAVAFFVRFCVIAALGLRWMLKYGVPN